MKQGGTVTGFVTLPPGIPRGLPHLAGFLRGVALSGADAPCREP